MKDFTEIRSFLYANVDTILDNLSSRRSQSKVNADELFATDNSQIPVNWIKNYTPLPDFDVLLQEKDSLGLYVSGNPLEGYTEVFNWVQDQTFSDDLHLILVNKVKKIFTKANQMMFSLEISTINEQLECIIFPKIAPQYSPILEEKELYWVRGKISRKKKSKTPPPPIKTEVVESSEEMEDTTPTPIEDEIKVYDELPKLLVESMSKFNQGVTALFREDMSLSMNRQAMLDSIKWDQVKLQPQLFQQIINDQSETKQNLLNQDSSSKKPILNTKSQPKTTQSASTPTLKITKLQGPEILNKIKNHRISTPTQTTGTIEIELWIETDNELKKVKGPVWLPRNIYEEISDEIKS